MTTTKSPSLEDVSSRKDERGGEERRRLPRLNLTTEQFRHGANGKVFSVADLSTGGMALRVLDRRDLGLFPVGAAVEGTLNLKREKHAVQARVRHVGVDLVGCEFENLAAESSLALQRYLDPALLGAELRPIPASDNISTWYHGPTGTDLLMWRKADGQYRRVALFVLGSFAQWEESAGVSTGRMNSSFEQSEVRGVMRFETMILEADPKPDQHKLNVAKTLILSSTLPQDLKKWCVRSLGFDT